VNPLWFAPVIALIGTCSAVINFYVRNGKLGIASSIIASIFTSALWVCMVKYANGKVINTSFIYDVFMTSSYVVVLFVLEGVKPIQFIGIAVACFGVYLMQQGK